MCFTHKFARPSSKQTDLSPIQDNLAQNLKFLISNRHVSRTRRVLICNMNTRLPRSNGRLNFRPTLVTNINTLQDENIHGIQLSTLTQIVQIHNFEFQL